MKRTLEMLKSKQVVKVLSKNETAKVKGGESTPGDSDGLSGNQ